MSIIKTKRHKNYTVIPNEIINDERLNDAALALLVFLLSKPESWEVRITSLERLNRFGKHEKICKTLKTLRETGYADYKRDSTGKTTWTITDISTASPQHDNPHSEDQIMAEPHSENPHSENPHSENPRPTVNKEYSVSTEVKKEERKQSKRKKSEIRQPRYDPVADMMARGIDEGLAKEFVAHRKAKRAQITKRVIDTIEREARKAGMDLEAALAECVYRGWVGFKAEWLDRDNASGGNSNGKSKSWRERNDEALDSHEWLPDVPF